MKICKNCGYAANADDNTKCDSCNFRFTINMVEDKPLNETKTTDTETVQNVVNFSNVDAVATQLES